MKPESSPESAGQSILQRLGIAEDPLVGVDPVSFLRSLAAAGIALVKDPGAAAGIAAANARLAIGSAAAVRASAGRAVGSESAGPVSPAAGDKRFADPAYADNPLYFLLAQEYLLSGQLVTELLDAAGLDTVQDTKARFAAKFIHDALAPTNTLLGNPAALRAAFDTGGKSVVRGAKNMLDDLLHNGGWPSQVDSSGFEVGVNMAATPGAVVYRSDLIELIQYTPQSEQVHSVPLLFCPPWINKYYIMDLAPGKSLIEWAVQHGTPASRSATATPMPRCVTWALRTTCARVRWMRFGSFVRSPEPPRSTPSPCVWGGP